MWSMHFDIVRIGTDPCRLPNLMRSVSKAVQYASIADQLNTMASILRMNQSASRLNACGEDAYDVTNCTIILLSICRTLAQSIQTDTPNVSTNAVIGATPSKEISSKEISSLLSQVEFDLYRGVEESLQANPIPITRGVSYGITSQPAASVVDLRHSNLWTKSGCDGLPPDSKQMVGADCLCGCLSLRSVAGRVGSSRNIPMNTSMYDRPHRVITNNLLCDDLDDLCEGLGNFSGAGASKVKLGNQYSLGVDASVQLDKYLTHVKQTSAHAIHHASQRDMVCGQVKSVDLGYGNMYDLLYYDNLRDVPSFPLNTLVFCGEIGQVLIKLGSATKYSLVNSRLSKVCIPPALAPGVNASPAANATRHRPPSSVYRSVICNNNIRKKKKKCVNPTCNYYHDPILGYMDNMHSTRQYPPNPQVPRCPTFRSGEDAQVNTSQTQWHDAITLYQSSLHNLLIAAVHSTHPPFHHSSSSG